ncbi:hypothetical protein BD626DRAFT_568266 [Schizophyllum amplum]|uniref:Uncharacterized protein n=1 Tax=Schizophyllum amplum TaxID=97359 RepID=A0A550CIE8_9AGAR|nr:hypothetical protein BD626DRAFT_568266 [Auriculariopsis ampla]
MFSSSMNGSHGYYKSANGAEAVYSTGPRRNYFAHSKYIPVIKSWHSAPWASTHKSSSGHRYNDVSARKYKIPRYHPLLKPVLEAKRRRATTSYQLGPISLSRGLRCSQRRGRSRFIITSSPPVELEFSTARQLWDAIDRSRGRSNPDIALRFRERADDEPDERPQSARLTLHSDSRDLTDRSVRHFAVFGYPTDYDAKELAQIFRHLRFAGMKSIHLELDDGANHTVVVEHNLLEYFMPPASSTLCHVSLSLPVYGAELAARIVTMLPHLTTFKVQAQDGIDIAKPLLRKLGRQYEYAKDLSYLELTCQGISHGAIVNVLMDRLGVGISPPNGKALTVVVRSKDAGREPRNIAELRETLMTMGIFVNYNTDMLSA